jgi:hypothetical protein
MGMTKRLLRAMAIGTGLALILTASALAKREVVRVGNLFLADNGGISPSKLPRNRQAPISAHIHGEIGTTDGSHPPAVQTVTVDLDKTIQVNAKGLPACRPGQLEANTTAAAKKACPDSIVGTGAGEVEVAFPEQAPLTATGPIVLFSGGVRGGTTVLFIHTYVAIPAPTAVVVTVKISHIHRGHFGLHTVAEIPSIAGGAGSATEFELNLSRTFTYKGKKQSFLTASCPTGSYYTEGEVLFSDGTTMGLRHILPCTPTG